LDKNVNNYLSRISSSNDNNNNTIKSTDSQESITVCCGCRPKAKRRTRKFQKLDKHSERWWERAVIKAKTWRYRDADAGEDKEWKAFIRQNNGDANSFCRQNSGDGQASHQSAKSDDESLYWFDAVDNPLGQDEYPIDGYAIGASNFKVVFTTSLPPSPKVSLSDPDSMLRPRSRASSMASSVCSSQNLDFEDAFELEPIDHPEHKPKIANHKEPSMRFKRMQRRSTEELTAELRRQPRNANALEDAIGLAGYPGTLTMNELEECQKFVRGLNDLPPSVAEQIYSLRDIEDQPYTICRWLRATKFDAEAILARCAENQPLFDEAKEHDFYGPDLEDHLGCPFSVFLSQYPFLSVGRGKNGSPVNYFRVGKIHPEGIMCLVTIEQLKSYFWYSFMHAFKDKVRASQAEYPEFCRCEGINVLDLSGLSSSCLTIEIMEVIKLCSKISDFFPETLHCMLVVNAPSFFTLSWKLIKNFIDPRTASRIQLFSSKEKGQLALEKLIDKEKQIPRDYGGGNISLKEAFLNECSDSKIVRQEIELLHCNRRGRKAIPNTWTLKSDESIEITVYTRSVAKASVVVNLNGSTIKTIHAQCNFSEEGHATTTKPLPSKTKVITSLSGPGEVLIEIKDMDSVISKSHSHFSRGYFLIVGDVFKTNKSMPSSAPSSSGGVPLQRRVSFSFDTISETRSNTYHSPYNPKKPPIRAHVTMTGLTFPTPIKVPPKGSTDRKTKWVM